MNLELVAAQSFFAELHQIANSNADEGTKEAAASLVGTMTAEDVESFLKEAGFGAMLGGVARGLGGLASGAAQGAGSMIAGAGRGAVGAARNAVSSVGRGVSNAASSAVQGVKGTLQRAGSAVASAPGALGQKMTDLGQAAQTKLTGMGQSLANAGANKGQAIQGRLAGPNPQGAARDIQMSLQAHGSPSGESGLANFGQSPTSKPALASPAPGALNRLDAARGSSSVPAAPPGAPAPAPMSVAQRMQGAVAKAKAAPIGASGSMMPLTPRPAVAPSPLQLQLGAPAGDAAEAAPASGTRLKPAAKTYGVGGLAA
jgi:hypothetical protein